MDQETLYEERVKALGYMLEVSNKYPTLWDDEKNLEGNTLKFFGSFSEGETSNIYIQKIRDKFSFNGRNLCNYLDKRQLSQKEVARGIEIGDFGYLVKTEDLLENFYFSLGKALGKNLSEETMTAWRKEYDRRS